jgi:hypothetical protein
VRRFLRGLGLLLLLLVLALVGAGVAARLSDGPLGPFPGGQLRAGELTAVPADWSSVAAVREVELQLVEPPRSRTTWIVVHDGWLYVPCGFLDVPVFKQWPYEAVRDGRAVLRIDGRRYEGRLVKVEDPALFDEVARLSSEKYAVGRGTQPDPSRLWLFRFEPVTG